MNPMPCAIQAKISAQYPLLFDQRVLMQFMQNGTINLVEYMTENNRNLAKDNKDLGKAQ